MRSTAVRAILPLTSSARVHPRKHVSAYRACTRTYRACSATLTHHLNTRCSLSHGLSAMHWHTSNRRERCECRPACVPHGRVTEKKASVENALFLTSSAEHLTHWRYDETAGTVLRSWAVNDEAPSGSSIKCIVPPVEADAWRQRHLQPGEAQRRCSRPLEMQSCRAGEAASTIRRPRVAKMGRSMHTQQMRQYRRAFLCRTALVDPVSAEP